jgi:hypothetical protein
VKSILQLVFEDSIPRAGAICLRPKIVYNVCSAKLSADKVINLARSFSRGNAMRVVIP